MAAVVLMAVMVSSAGSPEGALKVAMEVMVAEGREDPAVGTMVGVMVVT